MILQKYFTDGEKLTDEILLDVVTDAGLSKDAFLDYVTKPENLEKVVSKAAMWSAKGISGESPTLTIGGFRTGAPGACPRLKFFVGFVFVNYDCITRIYFACSHNYEKAKLH